MKSRERKLLRTYRSRQVQRISDKTFTVRGRKRKDGTYNEPWMVRVNKDGELECPCPAYGESLHCKHADTVAKWIIEGEPETRYPDADEKRPTYPQDWPRYRLARQITRLLERDIIRDLAQAVFPRSKEPRKRGRPWLDTADVIQCVCVRGITNDSSDHADAGVRQLWKEKFLFHSPDASKWPSPSAINRRMRSEQIRDAFRTLIRETALLTRELDRTFAIDGAEYNVPNRDPEDPDIKEAFVTSYRGKTIRADRRMMTADEQIRSFTRNKTVKLHPLVSYNTGMVVEALVTFGKTNESPILREIITEASKRHIIDELAADRGYTGDENAAFLEERRIRNLTPPKRGQKGPPGSALRRQYDAWFDPESGLQEDAGKRECAEGFFSRSKRVQREELRARTFLAQQTELLMLILLANIEQLVKLYVFQEIAEIPWLSKETQRELDAARDKVKDLPHPDLSPRYRDGLAA